jgi:molybdenum cofactor cytidylyltransferase
MQDIIPVVLAAGDSSRMGYPKALLPLGKDTFLTRILKTLNTLRLPDARVVLGTHEPDIRPLLVSYRVTILINPDPAGGQISSMKLAAQSFDPVGRGCLIWPVDQPLVSADLIRNLIRLFCKSAAPLALPRFKDQAGHPVIFGRTLIEALQAAPPDANPKLIVAHYKNEAAWLQTNESGTVEDIDTPGDYRKHTGETLESALARRR